MLEKYVKLLKMEEMGFELTLKDEDRIHFIYHGTSVWFDNAKIPKRRSLASILTIIREDNILFLTEIEEEKDLVEIKDILTGIIQNSLDTRELRAVLREALPYKLKNQFGMQDRDFLELSIYQREVIKKIQTQAEYIIQELNKEGIDAFMESEYPANIDFKGIYVTVNIGEDTAIDLYQNNKIEVMQILDYEEEDEENDEIEFVEDSAYILYARIPDDNDLLNFCKVLGKYVTTNDVREYQQIINHVKENVKGNVNYITEYGQKVDEALTNDLYLIYYEDDPFAEI